MDQSNHFWPKERPGPESAKTKYLPAWAALQMFPITGASSSRTCLRWQSQHHIRPRGPSPPSPDVPISYHLPEGKQTGLWHIAPRAAPDATGLGRLHLSPAGHGSRPHYCARPAPFQVTSRTWRRRPRPRRLPGRAGARAALAESRGAPQPLPGRRSPPSCPGVGPRASAAAGSRPPPGNSGSDLVSQQRLLVTATQLEAEAGGAAERGGAGARPPRATVGSGRGGPWRAPGSAAALTCVTTAATGGWGTGSSKSKPKMGNREAGAALRGVLPWCLGQKTRLGLPEIRASGGFFFLSSLNAPVPPGRGAPFARLRVHSDTRAGAGEGSPLPSTPRVSPVPPPTAPFLGPTPLRSAAGAWAWCPLPRGVSRTPGPCSVFYGEASETGGGGGLVLSPRGS